VKTERTVPIVGGMLVVAIRFPEEKRGVQNIDTQDTIGAGAIISSLPKLFQLS